MSGSEKRKNNVKQLSAMIHVQLYMHIAYYILITDATIHL